MLLVLQVPRVNEESKDLPVSTGSRAYLEAPAHLENQASQVIRVFQEKAGPLVRLARGGSVEPQGRGGNLGLTVCKDRKESREQLGQMGQRAVPGQQAHWATLALLGFRECREREEPLDPRGQRVKGALQERRAQRERQETTEREDCLAHLAHLDHQGPVVRRENLDPGVLLDLMARELVQGLEVNLVRLVLLGSLVHLVLMVSPE